MTFERYWNTFQMSSVQKGRVLGILLSLGSAGGWVSQRFCAGGFCFALVTEAIWCLLASLDLLLETARSLASIFSMVRVQRKSLFIIKDRLTLIKSVRRKDSSSVWILISLITIRLLKLSLQLQLDTSFFFTSHLKPAAVCCSIIARFCLRVTVLEWWEDHHHPSMGAFLQHYQMPRLVSKIAGKTRRWC